MDLKSTNKKALESLAKAGVFDSFGKDKLRIRVALLASMDSSVDKAAKIKAEKEFAQGFLFDSAETITPNLSYLSNIDNVPLKKTGGVVRYVNGSTFGWRAAGRSWSR